MWLLFKDLGIGQMDALVESCELYRDHCSKDCSQSRLLCQGGKATSWALCWSRGPAEPCAGARWAELSPGSARVSQQLGGCHTSHKAGPSSTQVTDLGTPCTSAEGNRWSLSAAPKWSQEASKGPLTALSHPPPFHSHIIQVYTAIPHQGWLPAQALRPLLGECTQGSSYFGSNDIFVVFWFLACNYNELVVSYLCIYSLIFWSVKIHVSSCTWEWQCSFVLNALNIWM